MLNFRVAFWQGLSNTGLLSSVGSAFFDLRNLSNNDPVFVSLDVVQVGGLAAYNTLQNRGYIRINPFPVFQFVLQAPGLLGFSNPDRIKDARSVDGDYLYLLRALQNEYQEDEEVDTILATPEFRAKWEFSDEDFLAAILAVVSRQYVVRRVEIPAVGQARFNQMRVVFTPQSQAFDTAALTEAQIKQLLSDRLISPTVYAFMALQFDGVRQVVPAGFYSKWGITPSALLAAIATLNENRFIQSFQGGQINLSYPANVVIPAVANPVLNQTGQLYQQLGRVESIQGDNFAGLEPSVLFRSLNQLQNAGLIAFQAGEIRLTWADFAIPSNTPVSSPAAPPVVPVAIALFEPDSVNIGSLRSYGNYNPNAMINGVGLNPRSPEGLFNYAGTESTWATEQGLTSGTIQFEFGQPQTINRFYFWPNNASASGAVASQCPREFVLELVDPSGTVLYTSNTLTALNPIEGVPQAAQSFAIPFTPNVKWVNWRILNNYGSPFLSVGKIGFSSVPVAPPAPAAPPVVPAAPPAGRSAVDLVFSSFGDENDVFYWIGSNGKTVPWSNPYPDEIGIMVSPPLNGFGFVGGQPASLSDRGTEFRPTSTNSDPNAFITIDLGAGRALRLTTIAILQRNDDGNGLLRGFNLLGSNDGVAFGQILVNELVVTNRNEWSRHVISSAAYRYFRLTQSQLNSSGDRYITIGEVALYGQLV